MTHFFIRDNICADKITIDLLIIPIDKGGKQQENFSENWEILFTTDRIKSDGIKSFVPLRIILTFDPINNKYKSQQTILKEWPELESDGSHWFDSDNGSKTSFRFDELPFFYMDAQRDILEDTKLRNSYLGKMLSKIEYSKGDIDAIEEQINQLNNKAVSSSKILSNIKEALKEMNSAMDNHSDGIEITPFTKKIRDLSKGLTIYYTDSQDSFSMEYHGMGTRSWSSLLTLKAFISLLSTNAEQETTVFFPILAIEEPEAHLHPNAQKKLYGQIDSIIGQKIISTHSPYIAATAELKQIRSFSKDRTRPCGKVDTENLDREDIRKINRQVINSRGEIFFSKLIVFCEGETEEQALPIFSKKYFGHTPAEMSLDFVGVGGCGNYLPFLRFTESLNIPWLIFSDAEKNTVQRVKEQFKKSSSVKRENDVIIFLDDGNNFEKQLIADGFSDEIKQVFIAQSGFANNHHKSARVKVVMGWDNSNLYTKIYEDKTVSKTMSKTMLAPLIADQIVNSTKALPPKVLTLFSKIKSILKPEELFS